uniref:Uncharacterized protein n=1 Tax=Vespula pensylvanica TaxID=30213 RepID=A0A834K6C2_VESPE|nr:hypothetical protein H0235_015708 [Vespula pensylvanica]
MQQSAEEFVQRVFAKVVRPSLHLFGNKKIKLTLIDPIVTTQKTRNVSFSSKAFVRILCVCCPRRMRRRYQPAFRCKPSQRFSSGRYYSAYSLHHMRRSRENSGEQTYI